MPEWTRPSDPARPPLPSRTTGPPKGPVASPTAQRNPNAIERRNLASREALLRRIAREYDQMPGLRLTAAQAQRLFGLRADVCARVLATLVGLAHLRQDGSGMFARHDAPQ